MSSAGVASRAARLSKTKGLLLGLCRFAGLRVIVTFAVNGRYFCAHTTQVRGKLAAMVNGVVQAEHQKLHRGHWNIPRKSTIFTNCSPGTLPRASKFFA